MTYDYDSDAVLHSLARLSRVHPRVGRDARIRERCYRVLDGRVPRTRRRSRPVTSRIADVALTAVLCGYAIVALVQAFRVVANI